MLRFTVITCAAVLSFACAAPSGPKPIPKAPAGSCDKPTSSVGGALEGTLCGDVTATSALSVAAGKKLVIGPGTVVTMPATGAFTVDGELDINGTKDQPVTITAANDWGGWNVNGTLTATFATLSGFGASLVVNTGAHVTLTDSVVDLENPATPPDCIPVEGGSVTLDHVKLTGCHCPLHVDAGDTITVTHTILDGADPIMITSAHATMHTSNFSATEADLFDLGGNFTVDVSGNYYGGGAPSVFPPTANFGPTAQQFSTTPLSDVGPR